jgi:hypothetical protein
LQVQILLFSFKVHDYLEHRLEADEEREDVERDELAELDELVDETETQLTVDVLRWFRMSAESRKSKFGKNLSTVLLKIGNEYKFQ